MIWRLTYCNKKGVEARVDIIKGDRSSVEIVQGSGNPFTISYRLDKTDKSGHIMTSSADIEIFETETFNIDDLKTSNETELKVEYFESSILTWAGFILPDFFSREIGSPNIVKMTASDRLTALKGITLSDLPTKVSLRDLIELSLEQTGLTLGLVAQIQINQGLTNILDSEVLSQRLTDVRGRSISCYDILMSIMVGTNSTIRQRAGQWQVYNKLEHELRTPTIFFDKVERGAIRTIQPVASSVGVYKEFGGSKTYPENYNFSDGGAGWTVNFPEEMSASFSSKNILGFDVLVSGGGYQPVYGTEDNNPHAVIYGFRGPLNYLKSAEIPIPLGYTNEIDIKFDINASGPMWNFGSHQRFSVFAVKGTKTQVLTSNGFVNISQSSESEYMHMLQFEAGVVLAGELARVSTNSLALSGKLVDYDGLDGYSVHIRLYSSDRAYATIINFASINFSSIGDSPKGDLYKTTQGSNFTKLHDVETTIFGDYITNGLNGYFYNYPIDDTSNLYLPNGELSSPIWETVFDSTERPLLHHVSRQKSRLFSVAHDILKANINVDSFDPLAVFQDCKDRNYIVVSANFDFLRSEVDVELEQIAYDDTILKRDFIYSYFGEGEDTIKNIGGISGGGGGGGTGGGLTPEQLEILSFWKKDPDNPDTIFTEMNAYSTKELSAYGVGDGGGGGGGSDYERLDTWASYDSSRAGWVLSAFLGNNLNTRVTNLENSAGSGSVTSVGISVPTGLSVSNSPITSSGVIAIGLQTGYSIPTTVKQGQWDTAYSNTHTHANKTVLDGITSGLISNWNTAFTNNHTHSNKTVLDGITSALVSNWDTAFGWGDHANKYSHIAHSGYFNSIRTADNRNVEDTPTSRNAGLYVDFKTSAAANLAGSNHVGVLTFRPYGVGTDTTGGGIMQIGSNNNSLYYRRFLDADTWRDWVSIWHSGDFTSTEVNNWREVRTWWQTVGQYLKRDATNQALYTDENFYSTKEVSAYGIGSGGGGGGGIIETVYGYGNLGQTFNNSILTDTFNAYTINQINTRLVSVENGSATTVNTTGTGNAITSISKAGTVITATKDLTFSLTGHTHTISDITGLQTTLNSKLETSIFNTHNNDNVRHITGAERTKWDGVVTDFGNLEIGGRNLLSHSDFSKGVLSVLRFSDGGRLSVEDGLLIGTNNTPSGSTRLEFKMRLDKGVYTLAYKGLFIDTSYWGATQNLTIQKEKISYVENTHTLAYLTFEVVSSEEDTVACVYAPYIEPPSQIEVEWMSLVRGDKPPQDWTPAPEDQVSDWLTTDVNSFSFIKNKPTLLSQFADNIGVATHIANTSNPHSVTKAQVGLGNVDNTSDLLKPISNATQTALNTKLNLSGGTLSGSLVVNSTNNRIGIADIPLPIAGASGYNLHIGGQLYGTLFHTTGSGTGHIQQGRVDGLPSVYPLALQYLGGNVGIGTTNPQYKLDVSGTGRFTGTVTAPTFSGALNGNAASATKLQTARTIAGVSFDGTANVAIPFANLSNKPTTLGEYGITDAVTLNTAQTISGAKTFSSALTASTSVTVPKVIFAAAGWSMEQVGSELQMKHNNVIRMRFTSTGSIVATEEITAFG